jgi:uncharacterized membrane protein
LYFKTLLFLHILGAIVGFGPTFAFAILGPLAKKTGGPPAMGIMLGMKGVLDALIVPIALTVQPITGVLLIMEGGWISDFFSHIWLVAGIVLYIAAITISLGINRPSLSKMIELAGSGQAGTPEFGAIAKRGAMAGPILTLLLLAIVFLMVWKPGA